MRTIQEVGLEIYNKTPAKFYVFTGVEIGIKEKYLNMIADIYGAKSEVDTVESAFAVFKRKQLIPLSPKLYVVRYDDSFLSSLTDKTADTIRKLNIVGTIVLIYETDKQVKKVTKYLDKFCVSIDTVSPNFVEQYLHSDFPGIADRFVKLAVAHTSNYGQAQNMCRSMRASNQAELFKLTDDQIVSLFGYSNKSTENQIKHGVASRNFRALLSVVSDYDGDVDTILYTILSTLIELEKIIDRKYSDSELQPYVKYWKLEDIYYMFMNTYDKLKQLRSMSIADPKNLLISLIALLPYSSIPSEEVFK